MDKRNMASIALATLILASSCNSSYEAAGGVTGAVIGARVGETIGFLAGSGFYRGESAALGSLIGTGVEPEPSVAMTEEANEKLLAGQLPLEEDLQYQAAVRALLP